MGNSNTVHSMLADGKVDLGLLKRIALRGFDLAFDYYLFFLKGKILSRAAEAFLATVADDKLLSHAADLKKQLQTARGQ